MVFYRKDKGLKKKKESKGTYSWDIRTRPSWKMSTIAVENTTDH